MLYIVYNFGILRGRTRVHKQLEYFVRIQGVLYYVVKLIKKQQEKIQLNGKNQLKEI